MTICSEIAFRVEAQFNVRFLRLVRGIFAGILLWGIPSGCRPAKQTAQVPSQPSAVVAQPANVRESSAGQPPQHFPTFTRLGLESGVNFVRDDDIHGQRRIFESTGGGAAVWDFDNDGMLDLFFTGGCHLPEVPGPRPATCALYHNRTAERFADVTQGSRLMQSGYCQGVAVGDFDNDGFEDIYIAAFGDNALWHNCGDGTFEELTKAAGVAVTSWSTSCAFADVDLDGNLDLYVATYLDESATTPLQCPNARAPDGFEQCPPSKFDGLDDFLFLGNGEGGFVDATLSSGLAGKRGKGLGLAICDFDGDGRPEIYVANDGEANFLFVSSKRENGSLALEDRGMVAGVALSHNGYAQASMGVAAGDYDGDGLVDLFLTNFYGDSNTLYKNLGHLHFEDVTRTTGLAGPSRRMLGWGTVMVDLNNDGLLDLPVANGHVEDRRWNGQGEPYAMEPQVFINTGSGKFTDGSANAGEYFSQPRLGRGLSWGDIDRDGRIDLVISQQGERSSVLVNTTPEIQRCVSVRLIGQQSNRSAIGVRAEIVDAAGKVIVTRHLIAGTSFQSSMPAELVWAVPQIEELRLRLHWPSGATNDFALPQTDSILLETLVR